MSARGFVLTPTWRLVHGRPAVHLHAVLASGEPALVVDDRSVPYAFVRAADAARVTGARVVETPLATLADEPVARVEVATPQDLTALRRRCEADGIPTYEADLRFAYRWLIDRGIRGGFLVDGPSEVRPGVGRTWLNPAVLEPADVVPSLRLLSLDIETSLDAQHLYSIAVAGQGGDRVWMVGTTPVAGAEVLPDEAGVLRAFVAHVRAADPDVLTGWNVCDFDLAVLLAIGRRCGVRLPLGRDDGEPTLSRDRGYTRESRAVLNGRVVLDGLALVRGSYLRLEDYRLETAARALLGRGKRFGPEGRGAKIESAYRDDPAALAAYNLDDARLVLEILETTGLVKLTARRSARTGMQLDRVGAQIAAIDSLYLGPLRRRGRVAPSVAAMEDGATITGGLVLDAVPGLHRNVCVFDFKSLYPSLVRTFNVDPCTWAPRPDDGVPVIRTPSGTCFRRDDRGILPALVDELWDERARCRAAGDETGAQVTKILMNSLFGVLGSPASRLFAPAVANAITLAGQWMIRTTAAAAAAHGGRVVYGDTDSLFVVLDEDDGARAAERGRGLRAALEADVAAAVAREFAATSRLELAFAKVYARLFLPELRGGGASKKRYAGLVGTELEIVGLEAVRRDWSLVARRFQRELLLRVLRDEPVDGFVRGFVAALRAGDCDAELVLRTAIRKPLASYTRTTPPHVQAARKAGIGDGGVVRWMMTTAGPEVVDGATAPPDHAWYVTHQLQPIADAVLRFVPGARFDDLAGLRRQLDLFS